jgi:hypothetical protein
MNHARAKGTVHHTRIHTLGVPGGSALPASQLHLHLHLQVHLHLHGRLPKFEIA